MIQRMKAFFQESGQEFRHINWPTFAETRRLTTIVVGFSLAIAAFLGVLDFIFSSFLKKFFIG